MGHSDVIDKKIVDHLKATDLPWLRYWAMRLLLEGVAKMQPILTKTSSIAFEEQLWLRYDELDCFTFRIN